MALVPDLEEVSRSFQTIRDNVDRLQNLPPFDGGAAILEELRALGRKLCEFCKVVKTLLTLSKDGWMADLTTSRRVLNRSKATLVA